MISGTAAVTFTHDEGESLIPTCDRLQGVNYTYGLTALDTPNTMLAVHGSSLLRSSDAGCSWQSIATLEGWDFPPSLVAAKGGNAYAWSDNRDFLVRIEGETVTKLRAPVMSILGIGVDRNDGARLRVGGDDGTVWESVDSGDTWTFLGGLRSDAPFLYRFLFNPSNLDHIVVGTGVKGAFVTMDGGESWTASSGLGSSQNVFNGAISPADGDVVWIMGINLSESDANVESRGRHIYRSTDGGLTFTSVVDASAEVTLVNGPVMAAHPEDPDVLYWIFGTHIFDYGTDIFRYDAGSGTLSKTHNGYGDINSIVFSPASPSVMYFGLESEQGVR